MIIGSKQECKAVVEAMKNTKNCRLLQRYQAIKLYLEGYPLGEIAKIIERRSETVNIYVSQYIALGLNGLVMKKPPGRPSFMTTQQKEELTSIIAQKTPEDVGFPAEMNWTAPLVSRLIFQQFQIQYSNRGTLRLLKELGFSCTRPTYTLANADRDKQEAFKKILTM